MHSTNIHAMANIAKRFTVVHFQLQLAMLVKVVYLFAKLNILPNMFVISFGIK